MSSEIAGLTGGRAAGRWFCAPGIGLRCWDDGDFVAHVPALRATVLVTADAGAIVLDLLQRPHGLELDFDDPRVDLLHHLQSVGLVTRIE